MENVKWKMEKCICCYLSTGDIIREIRLIREIREICLIRSRILPEPPLR